ncbi:hypothetical protein QP736_08120 [Enterococcus faecalis]|uniref:hypothetical protein n=1 Tax=Enterococcus faecalis TaxID=1351 RepID=UPI000AE6425F|nr:hypothetical protein [Enterococcus faecalis]EIW2161775.1 hypothetical protein [Enterococcus faecalis]MDK8204825.1 hypothetical protein [Enterococcus faecalis]MDU4367558.1 hypothetical protein [Enterococcus faecalis]MDU6499846.1 hypothetical protein [Enterococcus faecalis]MDV2597612.1 hypothetical protein [Enterococcus faecalis]
MKNYYHVKTQEAYDSLMAFLEVLGCKWSGDGAKPTEVDFFDMYEEETVIEVDENKVMVLGNMYLCEVVLNVTDFIEWTPELEKSVYSCVVSTIRGLLDGVYSLLGMFDKNYKALEEAMKEVATNEVATNEEPMYEIPLSCLKTTDGEVQYLSCKDKTWFASRKHTWLKQRFTETELKEKVPEFYRELAKEV